MEPYLTVSVPQGEYISATATSGGGEVRCYALDSNGYAVDDNTLGFLEPAAVTVTLPSPIAVRGASMGLVLDSLVSQSAGLSKGCSIAGTFSFTPAFALTSISSLDQEATNSGNGKALRLQGMIASVDGSGGFSLSRMYDQPVSQVVTWQVATDASTEYQGASGFSQLAAGMPVDMDATVQADGSLLASRIEIYDSNPANLTMVDGPLLETDATLEWTGGTAIQHLLFIENNASQGSVKGNFVYWDPASAAFLISGQLANVGSLPFPAKFDASSLAPGQHIVASTHNSFDEVYGNGYASAAAITLIPQTIDGMVSSTGSQGSFKTYTVELAPYDLFPQFAAATDQASALQNPATVVVYADSNTQVLNASSPAAGSMARFYGLVFNDNGTLRMDCAQINDGVPE